MKRLYSFLCVSGIFCLSMLGCGVGSGSDEAAVVAPDTPTTASQAPQSAAPEDEAVDPEELSSSGGGTTDPKGAGKRCYASCTVLAYGSNWCPTTVGGYGNTTFLGGCNKACNKAKGDAQSKLPPNCVLHLCNFSGC